MEGAHELFLTVCAQLFIESDFVLDKSESVIAI